MSKARSSHLPDSRRSKKSRTEISQFLDPFDNRALLGYFYDVTQWHGYCRFIGLSHLRESPDQPLQEIFVEPYVSRTPIPPDRLSSEWREQVQPALQAILENQRLVLLGDPGSGKSTLVSFLASQLSQPRFGLWQSTLGPLVPLPLVLRELKLEGDVTGDMLLEAVLDHAVAQKLRSARDVLTRLLKAGQGYFLLDGLDEIASLETRRAVRSAVFELAARFPACRFLLTSRVVGYEEVPFHKVDSDENHASGLDVLAAEVQVWAEVRYVVPFSDEQIEQFARNWYARREVAEELRETGARDLVSAIHKNDSTLRLARIPNLLTLMALIHRIQRRLPHGRVLLFDKIAEAYLESIDTFRGIQAVDYSLPQKRRWLAYVGFQMQLRRSGEEAREVLVDQQTVQAWVVEAMMGSTRGGDPDAARAFLDYIGRRSGILLPRGEGLFAFTHLSFQEYFAACYLAEQVNSPRWMSGTAAKGASPAELVEYANRVEWHETLVLVFELLADRPDWLEVLLEGVFGTDFGRIHTARPGHAEIRKGQLLAAVSIDPYSGLSRQQRLAAWEVCWRLEILRQQIDDELFRDDPLVVQRLTLAEQQDLPEVWLTFRRVINELRPKRLSLKGLSGPSAEEALRSPGLGNLMLLDLKRSGIYDVESLSRFTYLEALILSSTKVSDLNPLIKLKNLQYLLLSNTPVVDLSPLVGLRKLKHLGLVNTRISPEQIKTLKRNLPNLEIIHGHRY